MLTRIFFTTDIHGSEIVFRKFLNAGKFYKANVLIHGGDISGKAIVPIVEQADGKYSCTFIGHTLKIDKKEDLERLKKEITSCGYYPYCTTPQEIEDLEIHPEKVDALFDKLIAESLERWIKLAEEFLKNTNIECFICPGNDDRPIVDEILNKSEIVINPSGKIVSVSPCHEMVSIANSNQTPWNCPRDVPEDELNIIIEKLCSQVKNMANCIFNFHCPPYASGLDNAPMLDENLRPVEAGQLLVPVGSFSILNAIKKYQPLLGLHGHIHESRGSCKIGRTLCINPGSEYSEGILRGAIINLDEKQIKSFQFTSG
jgi:Icc-related predicted phosphoesterase